MIMNLAYMSFSDKGYKLAKKLAGKFGGAPCRCGRRESAGGVSNVSSLHKWTEEHFQSCDGIIFVGAMGIAVRAIAPFIRSKSSDPAVIVIDDLALHVIPVLSGHLGGANNLARRISAYTGSDCVITTATDINGIFAVDEWSKKQKCCLTEPKKISAISGRLLNGSKISIYSPREITGPTPGNISITPSPDEADVIVDIRCYPQNTAALHLVPEICVLGVGCRKGTESRTIEKRFREFIKDSGISPESIYAVSSIDIKKDEPGLNEFCKNHNLPLVTFSADDLRSVSGSFSSSEFVSSVTGVDNVCERSAVLASAGALLKGKTAGDGVTLALAAGDFKPDWHY